MKRAKKKIRNFYSRGVEWILPEGAGDFGAKSEINSQKVPDGNIPNFIKISPISSHTNSSTNAVSGRAPEIQR